MRFIKLIVFILALLICPHLTRGQKNIKYSSGYILIAKDTLTGFIYSDIQRLMHQSCKFKSSTDSPSTDYLPSQIKGFYSKEIGYFRSIENVKFNGIENGDYFFLELERGKAGLLLYQDVAGKNHFFLEKDSSISELKKNVITERNDDGAIVKRTEYLYRGALKSGFADCPQDVSKLNFDQGSLMKTIWSYNRCIDPQHKPLANSQRRLYLGYSYGAVQNNLTMDNYVPVLRVLPSASFADLKDFNDQKYSFNSATHGLFLEFGLGKNKHFSFNSGVLYSSVAFANSKLSFDYSNLDFVIAPKYSLFMQWPVRPFVAAGFIIQASLSNNSKSQSVPTFSEPALTSPKLDKDGNQVMVEPIIPSEFTVAKMHPFVTVGIDFFVYKNSRISGQVRFEKVDLSNSSNIDLKMSSIVPMVTYSYRILN